MSKAPKGFIVMYIGESLKLPWSVLMSKAPKLTKVTHIQFRSSVSKGDIN